MKTILKAAAAVAFLASGTFAATLTLTGVSGAQMGGVYTSPYMATINGTPNVYVICDDFGHNTYIGETWGANVSTYTVTNLTSITAPPVSWSGGFLVSKSGSSYVIGSSSAGLTQHAAYTTAAILAVEILQARQQGNQTAQSYLSYALWALFDGSAPLTGNPGLNSNVTNVQGALSDLYAAEQAATGNASYSGLYSAALGATVTVYDYNGLGVSGCGGCQPPPQEFLAVRMFEPSELAAMGADLFALAGLVFWIRRRNARAAGR